MAEAAVEAVPSITVRPFDVADGPAVARIWTAGLAQTVDSSSRWVKPLMRVGMSRLAASANAEEGDVGPDGCNVAAHWAGTDRCMFVAVLAGEVVGCCGVKLGKAEGGPVLPLPAEGGDSTVCSVWRVSVAQPVRRQGVGAALMARSEAWGREAGVAQLWLVTGNPLASQFYQKVGYRKVGWTEALAPWHVKELQGGGSGGGGGGGGSDEQEASTASM